MSKEAHRYRETHANAIIAPRSSHISDLTYVSSEPLFTRLLEKVFHDTYTKIRSFGLMRSMCQNDWHLNTNC